MKNSLTEQFKPDSTKVNLDSSDVREGLQGLLENEVRAMVVEEMKKGTQELLEEQRKMLRKSLEENKTILQQIVAEEKKAVWDNLDSLRKSIIKISF